MDEALPDALRVGRRALEELANVTIIDDFHWYDEPRVWVLRSAIDIDVPPDSLVPAHTEWYILLDSGYPWGSIGVYPSKDRGLSETFQHQSYNGEGKQELPWRTGKLCLDTSTRLTLRQAYDAEPYSEHARLKWHCERAVHWLNAAARRCLVVDGDPYELPEFPLIGETLAFCESADRLNQWNGLTERCGTADVTQLRKTPSLWLLKAIRNDKDKLLLSHTYGHHLTTIGAVVVKAIWLRLDAVPCLPPWKAVATWGELRTACSNQGIDLDALLKPVLKFVRTGVSHLLLIGFPIPPLIGSPEHRMHWLAIRLPVLSRKGQVPDGFRMNEMGYWFNDITRVIPPKAALQWLNTECWSQDEAMNRGRSCSQLRQTNTLIIGAGAVGCALAECLVRSGMRQLTIIDDDKLEAGNLVRHTLCISDILSSKAGSVAKRLNASSLISSCRFIDAAFPPCGSEQAEETRQCELIIDCTGSDSVLHEMESFDWAGPKTFISVSLGLHARRIYIFAASGDHFPHSSFVAQIQPWLRSELTDFAGEALPRKGIGCWHPVFPARIDDVWMMTAIASKFVEDIVCNPPTEPRLHVYEQTGDGLFAGIRRAELE